MLAVRLQLLSYFVLSKRLSMQHMLPMLYTEIKKKKETVTAVLFLNYNASYIILYAAFSMLTKYWKHSAIL